MYIIASNALENTTDLHDLNWSLSALNVDLNLSHLKNLVPVSPNSEKSVKPAKKQNVRQDLLRELYGLYLEACNKEYYVKNKKRYYSYIRSKHPNALGDKHSYGQFKDTFRQAKLPDHQRFLKPIKDKDYLWWGRFSHLKGEEGNECLRVMVSEATEMKTLSKGNIISYILGASGKLSNETPNK